MAHEVHPMPLPALVDLVNGWGTVPRARAADRDRPPIAAWLGEHGVAAAGATDAALERVADALYPVFAADGPAERAGVVNDLLAKTRIQPALGVTGGRIRPAWFVSHERDALLAAGAVALHAQLAQHESERLGTCGASACGDAFADASPGAHRRYCSVTCQTRERVAAFRRRRAGA